MSYNFWRLGSKARLTILYGCTNLYQIESHRHEALAKVHFKAAQSLWFFLKLSQQKVSSIKCTLILLNCMSQFN